MNDEPELGPSARPSRRRAALGYDARSERRTLRRAAQRRKARTRLGLVAGPAIVVIAVVVTLFLLFGGPGHGGTGGTSTTIAGPVAQSDLLIVEEDGTVPVMVLLQTRSGGGLVLAMPGMTLLESRDAFKTLSEIHASDQDGDLTAAFAAAFGVQVRAVASVAWSSLRSAMVGAGLADIPAATLTSADGEADQVARAVMALIRGNGSEGGAAIWQGLALTGDSSDFLATVSVAATSAAGGDWTVAALTGRVVEGEGSKYLEPKVDRVKALLAGATLDSTITIDVQNGSGVVGIAEQATAQLKPLGYAVVSSGNSDDFPNATQTRITASTGTVAAGEQVQGVLGVGTVTEDPTLESDHVVVVLGKDYAPPASTGTDSSG